MASTLPTEADFVRMQSIYGENKEIKDSYDKSLSVICENGIFVGKDRDGVIEYKGIPFAKPPIGDRRWKAPEYVDKSTKVMEAYYFGKTAIQAPWFSELASCYPQSEDCLYLNIWSNTAVKENKTVMVFIHGGAYGYGGTSDPIYDGYNFVKNNPDILMVTIAYRVGVMGFIDFSFVEGGDEFPDSQNLGILDQIMALRWINNNIASFGGNKDNITIFGESAGGGSVSILPVAPMAKGLFKRAIGESGSIALTFDKEECRPFTEKFMKLTNTKNMKEIFALNIDKIVEANKKINDKNNFPMRDGRIIPKDLYKAYRNGESAWCEMINGTNKDECRYWMGEMGGATIYSMAIPVLYDNQLAVMNKIDQTRARKHFAKNDEGFSYLKITEFENDIIFRCPAQMQLRLHSMNGGKAYNYFWTYPSAIPNYGACHAVELNHIFGNLDEKIYTGENINPRLSKEAQTMWANFARTGNPSTDDEEWPLYDAKTKKTLILGETIFVKDNLLSRRSAVVDPLLKYLINGNYSVLKLNTPYIRTMILKLVIIIGIIVICIFFGIKYLGNF